MPSSELFAVELCALLCPVVRSAAGTVRSVAQLVRPGRALAKLPSKRWSAGWKWFSRSKLCLKYNSLIVHAELYISMHKQILSFFFIIYFIIPLVGLIKRRHQAQKRNWRTSLTFANIVILLHCLLVSGDVSRGPWLPTWGCCTASLGTSLHSRSSVSRRSRTTTQTSGHAGASDPHRPFSRTVPDDTTGKKKCTS